MSRFIQQQGNPKGARPLTPGTPVHRPAPGTVTQQQGNPKGARPLTPGAPVHAKHAKKASHAKKATHAKKAKRGLARSATEVACCAAEALAASLRLAGGAVSDEDVLALYWLTADDADAGATILATLEAAAEHGLASMRPSFEMVLPCAPAVRWPGWSALCLRGLTAYPGGGAGGLILGAELPGPHALYDDGEAWWSWGEPFDPASFPGAVIGEAWEVRWSA